MKNTIIRITAGIKRNFTFLAILALSSSLPLGSSLAGEGVSFMDPIDFGVGRSPRSVTVGDFNGDQIQDLAVANFGSNDVSILLGKGDGTFSVAQTVPVGTNPYFVTVGDFNGDQAPDLAVANSGSNDVSILLGNGNGTFELVQETFRAGTGPWSVAIGDFNGDRNQDLAVANFVSNNVSILLGHGDGTFVSAEPIAVQSGASFVAVSDFDGDGNQDLAVTTYGMQPRPSTVSILLGNGDGTFRLIGTPAVGTNPVSIAVGDFNENTIPDLAVTGFRNDTVSVLLGKGDGTFEPTQTYFVGGFPSSIAVGDFDGDGIPDLVTANQFASLSVLIGNGNGTFQPTRDFWAGADPVSVVVGDFNADAFADVAVANLYSNDVSILLNDTPQPGDGVTILRNVRYYEGAYSNPRKRILDVYRPADKTGYPVVFLVYGGAWKNGEKSRLGYLARTLAREGLGVGAINHRLTDGSPEQVVHPGHIVDVARAFAWTYSHIADFGGNPDQIVLLGHSSGAHLVALLATDERYLAAHGLSPEAITGVIAVSGAYDLRRRPERADIFGDEKQRWEASPLRYVDGTQPPFLILSAQFDDPVTREDSTAFYEALVESDSEAEVHEIPDRDHPGIIGRAARPGDPARELMLRFIAEHTAEKP